MSARHLYVHVPFCSRRCTYCDFSIAVRRNVPVDDYLRGVSLELDRMPHDAVDALETVYLGGGTPSRIGVDGVERLMALLGRHFDLRTDAELTLEANPEDVSVAAVKGWQAAGINRLSIGVQSFDDRALRWMHRVHDSGQARSAVASARDAGIENVSLDLIFSIPPACGRSWRADLEEAVALAPSHISLYGLTVEPRTPLARLIDRKEVEEAGEDGYASEFLLADELARAAGYEHYEVSNFALPGSRSRHNSAYWSGAAYIGVGPSAHSFDGGRRRWNVEAYSDWLRRLEEGRSIVRGEEALTSDNRLSERIYLGLRTASGLDASAADLETAKSWQAPGWAVVQNGSIRLTAEGWLRLDALAAALTGT